MESREEFCRLALQAGSNRRELCRRYGISPTTGYTWLERYQGAGRDGLVDRSRRPHHSPEHTSAAMAAEVVALRQQHPTWGGRKLRARLLALDPGRPVPSASSITRILQRHGLIDAAASDQRRPPIRFCAPFPNDLWQMDFKGHFPLAGVGRCHPLTVLDDASRFNLALRALANEQTATVKPELIRLFRCYGLPNRILCDNGAPWGNGRGGEVTALGVWLLQLDVLLIHGRPAHPETQGKDERFHRTLGEELLAARSFGTLTEAQCAFEEWRECYNLERPHEALDLATPISRYHLSPRPYPERLPPVEYPAGTVVRRVKSRGEISFGGRVYFVGAALHRYPVALHPTDETAVYEVHFRHYRVGRIDCREPVEA
jgi:transposase InsO family protein